MASPWTPIGQIANVTQLVGIDAISLVAMIVKAASYARMHKKNCRNFAEYVQIIGDLLSPLNISELNMYPETKAPLQRLEDALRKAFIIVYSCQDSSFIYLLFNGWNITQKLRRAEGEIERYLRLIPLVTLVDLQRLRQRREKMGRDQSEQTPNEKNTQTDTSPHTGSSSRSSATNFIRSVRERFKSRKGLHLVETPPIAKNVNSTLAFFTLHQLRHATNNFHRANIVGSGEFTVVYRGKMDGISVAVKLWENAMEGSRPYENEINLLLKMSHPNLIRLMGYCNEKDKLLLVYELMDNGSLESQLRDTQKSLTWAQRIKILVNVAEIVSYLHTSEKHIIHRDLKPSVILLDSDFSAKLSGFGWSRDGPSDGASAVSTQVIGTPGYLDPDYILTGHLDEKTDVYAFGIVLLQLLSGNKVTDMNRPSRKRHLIHFAKDFVSDASKLPHFMDPKLEGRYPLKDAMKLAAVSQLCTQNDRNSRPVMSIVLKVLQKCYIP